MFVFEWLKNWFEDNKQIFEEKKIKFSFSELINENTDKPSQYVDIDTKNRMARISLWETGECDFEIIDNETAKQLHWQNRVLGTQQDLSNFLNECFSKL